MQNAISLDNSGAGRFMLSRDFWRRDLPMGRAPFGKAEALLWLVAQAADEQSQQWQFACRVQTLAMSWRWTERKVFRFLKELESAGTLKRRFCGEYWLITINAPEAWCIPLGGAA